MEKYYPEGILIDSQENQNVINDLDKIEEAARSGKILEAYAVICDKEHNLIVDLPCIKGIIPRTDGAIGIEDGSLKDVALISRVSKPVCFKVMKIIRDKNGTPSMAVLSRKAAQNECYEKYVSKLRAGDIIDAKVTHIEQFGCFVDIGCGISSMIPVDSISVSRISDPSDRFDLYQNIKAVVKSVEQVGEYPRIYLSHKELLGTWMENASMFHAGETVTGIIRSVESYGIFVELAPNLAGLAEHKENIHAGQLASVYIKALIPDKMKVKLVIADPAEREPKKSDIRYFINSDHIDYWRYTPENAEKLIETRF
ncbi:MAG: S1 RNA-binding domain-containing protein [Ruminococcus sp.]|nr:S1 RNA-binding domain-containing protein [Ruminococcus sp.]